MATFVAMELTIIVCILKANFHVPKSIKLCRNPNVFWNFAIFARGKIE